MNEIKRLKQQIEETEGTISAVSSTPSGELDFATRLSLESLRGFEAQLRSELRSAMNRRDLEIVEFRLMGDEARDGSLPLDTLGMFATELHRGLMATATFKKTGKSPTRVRRQLRDEVEFQMSGLAAGSTKIYVSGRSATDIFGDNLAADTIQATFSLFEADSEDSAIHVIEEIGQTGARRYRDLLSTLAKKDLELEVRWSDPQDDVHLWRGTRKKISRAVDVLGSLAEAKDEMVTMRAIVEGINRRGRLELRRLTDDFKTEGPIFRVTYFYNDLEKVRPLRINDVVDVELRRTTVRNEVTRKKKTAHFLKELEVRTDIRRRT